MVFSSHQRLRRHTGSSGTPRATYIARLVEEFHGTKSHEAKKQVLGNLANFAYDPINYDALRSAKAVDLFLSLLVPSEQNEAFVDFALAGLCNVCLDPSSRNKILSQNGVTLIINNLGDRQKCIILPALTLLYYLWEDMEKNLLRACGVPRLIQDHLQSESPEVRSLAQLLLQKHGCQ